MAPGVTGPGHPVRDPPTVSHWFSLALSPEGGVALSAFWFGNPPAIGAPSGSGGYEPSVPGRARALGAKRMPSTVAVNSASSPPRVHLSPLLPLPLPWPLLLPLPKGHLLVSSFCTGFVTWIVPARPNGPEHPLG